MAQTSVFPPNFTTASSVTTPNKFFRLRYSPFLTQIVVIRRCNLSCGYCSEYDKTSEPVPFELLSARLAKLRELRTWAVCLTGGEPTLHPRLPDLISRMQGLGFRRRQLITNGMLLSRA